MQVRDGIERIEKAGAAILVVAYTSPEYCQAFAEHMKLPFPVASAPDRRIYNDYGLGKATFFKVFNPLVLLREMAIIVRHRRTEGRTYRRPTREDDLYQLGADFVISATGTILYAHHSKSPDDRPSLDEMMAVLEGPR